MNRDEKFVHLHVHTEYSLLDGLSQINRLMARAKDLDMTSMAITDHGVMFGVIDFFRAAKANDIKPIIGMEAYLAPRSMEDRDAKLDKKAFHMLLLAKNATGYANLMKLASEAQLRGYYYNPRIDRELLARYSEGIIATSGCLGAQIPQSIMKGDDQEARELIGWYQEVFGAENFFLELQYHDIDVLEDVNRWLAEYRKSGHTPVQWVATNDVHYVLASDHDPHDTLLCIQTGNLKTDGNRLRMSDASYHLTSHEEMEQVIKSKYNWLPDEMRFEALLNSARIAAMCEVNLETEGYHLPRFPVPDGHPSEAAYLRYLAEKGRYWRYGANADSPVYVERMEHELNIIHTMGFDTYFLIVWDLCEFARHADIWWNVRGSGAGSMVAYCLGITSLDPIQNSLIFERFLNPGRNTMPDVDLDYPDDRRNEMIEYTARKYGSDKVASIITFGTMGAKAAIRDVGRALNVPLPEVNAAVSMIPTEARQRKIEEYVDANPELTQLYKQNTTIRQVIDTAKVLQGVSRHASTHAAGVIVADKPLVEYIPLHRLTRGDDENSSLKQVTQFPMETCESLGLLKIDFLGLSTLTIMRRASDLIYRHHKKRWTMENIPYRPHEGENLSAEQLRENEMLREAFEMMGDGATIGVFQIESPGMQQMLRGMRPTRYEHIVAGISLYRPGPMDYIPTYNARMRGDEDVHYHHPKLEPILAETYGILVYQEQIMQVASALFGYQMGEADLMRRAVSKKKQKDLLKHKQIFMERGPENGVSAEAAEKIFDDIEFFANYGFNKSHAADYAMVTVQTGFLKCHYPAEYMAALLSVYREDTTRVSTFLEECGRLQIPILPPDVNHSHIEFDIQTLENGVRGIRFGLAAVKNAGVAAVQRILDAREEGGAFTDLTDFCERVDLREVGKRTLESLIRVGALDMFSNNRQALLEVLDRMLSFSTDHHRAKDVGQMSMFGTGTSVRDEIRLPIVEDADPRQRLNWEKELLGFYVTAHPVDAVMRQVKMRVTRTFELREMNEIDDRDRAVSMIGLVASLREIATKGGDMMAVVGIEDRYGTQEVVFFPRVWERNKDTVRENLNRVALVKGKVDFRRGDAQVIGDLITTKFEMFAAEEETPSGFAEQQRATYTYEVSSPSSEAPEEPPPINWEDRSDEPPVAYSDAVASATPTPAPVPTSAPASGIDWAKELAHNPHLHEAEPDQNVSRWVMVYFKPDADNEKNRRRIHRIHGRFMEYHGQDRFTIVVEGEEQSFKMEFPNKRTGYCEALRQKLIEIVGAENVEVFDKP